jgi:decaprenyl-phosphate phosphoribosyltransferase
MSKVLPLVKLMRPEQWIKGVAILIGAAASGLLFENGNILSLFLTFLVFSLCSSAVYIMNDFRDIVADQKHPKKKYRPMACGAVSKISGLMLCGLLIILSTLVGAGLDQSIKLCILVYVLMNVFYSFVGKHLVVLELLIVASGFILRGLAGVYSVGAEPSMWFNLLAMFASLLLVSGKRLAEKNISSFKNLAARSTVQRYSFEYLTSLRTVSISGLLMTYFLMVESKVQINNESIYTFWLQVSLIPYIYCVLSLALFLSESDLEEPHTVLFRFKPLFFGGVIWATIYAYAIYGVQL